MKLKGNPEMNMEVASALINGVFIPLMGVMLIPRALREAVTGKYQGFKNVSLIYYAVIIASLQMILIFPRFGVSLEMIYRLVFVTVFPFLMSYFLVKISDKFQLKMDYQIRKSNQKI